MNINAFLNTITNTARTLPIVILYVTEGCNLKCITCSYREPQPGELSLEEIKNLAGHLSDFGLKHIVYSGGEPLLRRDFKDICENFKQYSVKQSLLTNGLLLDKRIDEIQHYFHEIIVSIDGGKAETHNKIRGVNSFDLIMKGISKAVKNKDKQNISIRTVLQKSNFRELPEMINMAKSAGVDRISFLSADVASEAFGRDTRGAVSEELDISLGPDEVNEFREIVNQVIKVYSSEFISGFISESPQKLLKMVDYYGALCGLNDFPKNFCNAPMVSAVITSTGNIHPCYFIESYGNIRKTEFKSLINIDKIRHVRKDVRNFTHPRCKTCVCTLNVSKANALFDGF
ncbi:MAG TPA: radical SAM protein [Ignavibacteria bacterium]|nr:radical SAM protein [Ignavibacteria bacterium]